MTTGWSEEDIHETDPHRRLLNRCGPDRRRARVCSTGRRCHFRSGGSRQNEGGATDHLDRRSHRARDHDLLRHGGARIPHARRQGVRRQLARPGDPGPAPDARRLLRAIRAGRERTPPRRPPTPRHRAAGARRAVEWTHASILRTRVGAGPAPAEFLRQGHQLIHAPHTRHRQRGKPVRKSVALSSIQLGFLAACGGGGYMTTPPPPTQMIATPGPPNVETITVDAGPPAATFASFNTAFVSVTVCVPGTSTCKTIDHIWLDTGSSGLRIIASVLTAPPAITLPSEKDAGMNPFAECYQFVDGTIWGSLGVADITLPVSMETASNVHVHIIGDPAYPTVGSGCTGVPLSTVSAFGANGILGVGPFAQDCGSFCVTTSPAPPVYYSCPSSSTCAAANVSLTEQVANTVTMFTTDNRGVIVELPAVGSAGATTVSGSLVFGIGTRTNNGLGTATVLPEDPNFFITATYKGTDYTGGYLDSGSNGNFFTDSSLTVCTSSTTTGFYCPGSTMSETATLK